jgi:hypothetical protein
VAGAVVAAVAALSVSAVFLTRSPGIGVNTGPLGGGPVDGSVCLVGPHRLVSSVSNDDFQNKTGSPIRVEKFSLVNAKGLRLLGVDLVPIVHAVGGGDLLVDGGSWPLSHEDLLRTSDARWDERQTVPMTMPPDKPTHSWNLVFGIRRTAATGTATYQLQYEWQGRQYIWTGLTEEILAATAKSCPSR